MRWKRVSTLILFIPIYLCTVLVLLKIVRNTSKTCQSPQSEELKINNKIFYMKHSRKEMKG